jgi:hypothetical protein
LYPICDDVRFEPTAPKAAADVKRCKSSSKRAIGCLVPEQKPRVASKKRRPASDGHRATSILASLQAGDPTSAAVYDAFWELDAMPAEEVRAALGVALPEYRLRTVSIAKDADVLDLGPVAEEQLRLAGKSWDGVDLAPEERLDGELEGSFAGTLERRVLADTDAPGDSPLFDVLSFAGDSGVVFEAGTTNVVALIAYHKVEMRDRRTREAIESALAAPETPVKAKKTAKKKAPRKAQATAPSKPPKRAAQKPAKKRTTRTTKA